MKSHSLLLLLALLLCGISSFGQVAKVHALYLYQFAKGTSWPIEDANQPFIITVIGDNELVDQLRATTNGKKVGNREVYIIAVSSTKNLPKSDIIFLGEKFTSKISSLLSDQANKKVLIVSASQGQCSHGACISFVQKDQQVSYQISERNISNRGLRMTPKIISFGQQVS